MGIVGKRGALECLSVPRETEMAESEFRIETEIDDSRMPERDQVLHRLEHAGCAVHIDIAKVGLIDRASETDEGNLRLLQPGYTGVVGTNIADDEPVDT